MCARWLLVFLVSSTAVAQVRSGPEAGMAVAPIRAYATAGEHRGQEFDLAAAIGPRPAAVLFVQTVNRETAPVMRLLDELAAEYRVLGFRSFTVRLHDDRTAGEEEIQRFSNALQLRNPIVLSLDGAEGPGDYALNRRCTLTLVTTKHGVVVESIPFTDTGAKDEARLRAAVEKVTGALPESLEERAALLPDDFVVLKEELIEQWREIARLRAQVQRLQQQRDQQRGQQNAGGGRMQEQAAPAAKQPLPGAVPDDDELVGFMRRFNRAKTDEEVDALFAAVDTAIGDDQARRDMMVQGFVRLLATTYGTDYARTKARAYVDRHAPRGAERGR
ncbi:MAG: hypothetical protein R3F29_06900 [Planctomycetota bacterium]